MQRLGLIDHSLQRDRVRHEFIVDDGFLLIGGVVGSKQSIPAKGQVFGELVVPLREIRLLGSISGMWKRSYGSSIETPPDERGGYSCDEPTATAPHLDFTRKTRRRRKML
jgi:hypothetical protein